MSTYPTLLPEQCNKVILSERDNSDQHDVIDNVDNNSLNPVPSSASSDHAKTECLTLINKIWKDGLDCKLEQFRNHDSPSQRAAVVEAEDESCKRCLELNGTVFHVTDGSCALQSGTVQSNRSHSQQEDLAIRSHEGESTLLSSSVESTLMNKKLKSVISSGKMLNSSEELTSVGVSSSPLQNADLSTDSVECLTSCNDSSDMLQPRIGPVIGQQQDGASSLADFPPFKKARYSWQVKNNKMKGVDSEQADRPVSCHDINALASSSKATNLIQESDEDIMMTTVHQNVVSTEMTTQAADLKENSTRRLLTSSNSFQDVGMLQETSSELGRTNINNIPPQGVPRHPDFNKLTEALTQLTHTERWQCQHVAKAIVDNAINKTLEEMGLSPGSNVAVYHEQRSRIEDAGVSQAILSRGLRRYTPRTNCMHHLNPLIDRLTNMSENMLSEHGGEVLLENNTSAVNGQLVPSEMMDIYFNLEGPLSGQVNSQEDMPSDVPPQPPSLSLDVKTNISSTAMQRGIPTVLQSKILTPCGEGMPLGEGHLSGEEYCSVHLPENSAISYKQGTTLDEVGKGPTAMYILDQAVNAVICERGLQCQEFF